jgi:hypothetical protein
VLVASNKVSVYKDKLNTNSDQKREKFLIRITLAFSIKKQPGRLQSALLLKKATSLF